jgi:hypothetical protein
MLFPSDGHASWCVFGCRLRQERDMAVMTKHLAIDMPGDLHDGFVAGAIFGHSVMRVCRLSCHRPFTFAFLRVVFQVVLNEVMCRAGSEGLGLP